MNKQPGTQKEREIWEACETLWAEFISTGNASPKQLTGEKVKARLIKLGYKPGNPNRLYQFRNSWLQAQQLDSQKNSTAISNDPIHRAVKQVHADLQRQFDERIEAIKKDCDTKVEEARSVLAENKHALEAANTTIATLEEKYHKADASNKTVNEALQTLTARHALTQQHNKTLESQLTQMTDHYEHRLLELKDQQDNALRILRGQIEDLKQEHQTRRNLQLQQHQNALSEVKATLKETQQHLEVSNTDRQTLAASCDKFDALNQHLQSHSRGLELTVAEAKKHETQMRQKLQAKEVELAESVGMCGALHTQIEKFELSEKALQERVTELLTMINHLEHKLANQAAALKAYTREEAQTQKRISITKKKKTHTITE